MSHPAGNHLRDHKVQRARVSSITAACGGGMSSGGGIAPTVYRKDGGAVTQRADGGSVRQRSDRPARAFGGRLGGKKKKSGGKKGHTVNVIVAPHTPAAPALPPKPPMVPGVAAGPPPMPPKPMMPPPVPGAGPPPGGLGAGPMPPPGALPPPGMPPRYAGGRAYKKGGAVFSGAQMKVSPTARGGGGSIKANSQTSGAGVGRTPLQPSPNKQDGKNIGRGSVITKAAGGPIYSPSKGRMAPHAKGGAGGGLARLDEAHHPEKYRA